MEENFWSSKFRTFKVNCSFPREMKRNVEVNVSEYILAVYGYCKIQSQKNIKIGLFKEA